MRLDGASYEEITRAGGGIASTVRDTRAVDEIKMLKAARRMADLRELSVATSFLGAHAVPLECADNREAYLRLLIEEILPEVAEAGLADAVDAFFEEIAFSPDEVAPLFEAAHVLGLPVKLHADQRTNGHGGDLAARFKALLADHVEYADEAAVRAIGKAGTVAVRLPGAFYFLRETQKPPVDLFCKHGVAMALATDCNIGTNSGVACAPEIAQVTEKKFANSYG